jgi:hypothetical protein
MQTLTCKTLAKAAIWRRGCCSVHTSQSLLLDSLPPAEKYQAFPFYSVLDTASISMRDCRSNQDILPWTSICRKLLTSTCPHIPVLLSGLPGRSRCPWLQATTSPMSRQPPNEPPQKYLYHECHHGVPPSAHLSWGQNGYPPGRRPLRRQRGDPSLREGFLWSREGRSIPRRR